MPAVGKMRAGKNARATVAGTNMRKTDWETDFQADDIDSTNFESGGFDQGTVGITSCPWTLKGPWDASLNDYDDPPGLYPRDDLGLVRLYTNTGDNVFWNLPNNRVLSAKNSVSVRQLVMFEASCKTQGSFSRPTGSA